MTSGMNNGGIVPGLAFDQYRQQIKLDEPYQNGHGSLLSAVERATIVARLLDRLIRREHLADIGKLQEDLDGYIRAFQR